MGYIRHHAIIVTSFDSEKISKAHSKAIELFGESVSAIVPSPINRYTSFFVGPDGSKEGWADSEIGDNKRKEFFDYIQMNAYDDGSNALDYAEIFYGDDEGEAGIVNHN